MGNGNAPTLQSMCFCEENCRQTYTDWTAVSPETTETGVADLFYTVLFNGTDNPTWTRILMGASKGDIFQNESLRILACLSMRSNAPVEHCVAERISQWGIDTRH